MKGINLYTNSKFLFFAKGGREGMVEETCLPYPTLGTVCTPGKGKKQRQKQGDQELKVRLDYRDSVKRKKKRRRGLGLCLGLIPKTIKLATEESQM